MPEMDRGESSDGSLDPPGSHRGTLRSPARQCEVVGHAVTRLHVSERRASRAIGQFRFFYRYRPCLDTSHEQLRERIIALVKEYRAVRLQSSDGSVETRVLGRGQR